MNRKRNVAYIKPEDPEFLKILKRQAGYDDSNHKFDELQNAEEDFAEDQDSEKPQVVVLKEGDLTEEQAEIEMDKIRKEESETKADLSQRVIFKSSKTKTNNSTKWQKNDKVTSSSSKKNGKQLLSFADDADEDEET